MSQSQYPDWLKERFGDDIPEWAEDRWGNNNEDKN
jgi:hypothetical protein